MANKVRVIGVSLDASTPATPHKVRVIRAAISASDPALPHKVRVIGAYLLVSPADATRPSKVWDGSLWRFAPTKSYTGTVWA